MNRLEVFICERKQEIVMLFFNLEIAKKNINFRLFIIHEIVRKIRKLPRHVYLSIIKKIR